MPRKRQQRVFRIALPGTKRCGPSGSLAQPLSQSALAALLPRGRPSDPAAAARPRGCALGVIAPDDVSVVVGGGDLDKAVPEFGASDVLFGLLPAHITLEHDVAVIG